MREVQLLTEEHRAGLEQLLALQATAQTEQARRNSSFYLAGNGQAMAIGVTENRVNVEQALLTFFQRPNANHDYLAVTTAVTKTSMFISELFDMLCASCSSATPVVALHLVITTKSLGPVIKKAWQGSRLGRYTVKGRELTIAEGLDLVGELVLIDNTHQLNLFMIEYPSADAGLQLKQKSVTIRCKYC